MNSPQALGLRVWLVFFGGFFCWFLVLFGFGRVPPPPDYFKGIHLPKTCLLRFGPEHVSKLKVKLNYLQKKHHSTLRFCNTKKEANVFANDYFISFFAKNRI